MKRLCSLISLMIMIAVVFGFVFIVPSGFGQGEVLPDIPNVPEEVDGQESLPIRPQVPVIIDGIWVVDPETFAEHYSMADLVFVVTEDALAKGVLYAFSSDEELGVYNQEIETSQPQQVGFKEDFGTRSLTPNYYAWVFSGYNYGGVSQQWTSCGSVSWYYFYDFNDLTSSLRASNGCGNWSQFFEHGLWLGRKLKVQKGLWLPDLRVYSWDNIISSHNFSQ